MSLGLHEAQTSAEMRALEDGASSLVAADNTRLDEFNLLTYAFASRGFVRPVVSIAETESDFCVLHTSPGERPDVSRRERQDDGLLEGDESCVR